MSRNAGIGLTKVTVASTRRRVDIALPNTSVVAELMPMLLRHVGEDLADEGQQHGGWTLRRADGDVVDLARSIGVQEVRDGEVLHLVPRREEWPELDFDDVVDAIATDARTQSRTWGSRSTRRAGVAVATGAVALALVLVLSRGADWLTTGIATAAVGVVCVLAAIVLSRAVADSGAGVPLAVVGMVGVLAGGTVALNGDAPLSDLQPPQFLVGFAALLLASVAAYAGVADRTQWFVAGVTVALLGLIGSLACLTASVDIVDAAAILVAVVITLTPTLPLLSIRLGKLPMPTLPTSAEDLLADPPPVSRSRVYATVRRSDELLTGMLVGCAVVVSVCSLLLVLGGRTSGLVLVAVVAVASLLRTRLFPATRHRLPLLVTGLVGLAGLALATLAGDDSLRLLVGAPALGLVALVALAAGLGYQNRTPSPYFGRIADILDVLLVLSVIPVACVVTGLYSYVRGLAG